MFNSQGKKNSRWQTQKNIFFPFSKIFHFSTLSALLQTSIHHPQHRFLMYSRVMESLEGMQGCRKGKKKERKKETRKGIKSPSPLFPPQISSALGCSPPIPGKEFRTSSILDKFRRVFHHHRNKKKNKTKLRTRRSKGRDFNPR